MSYKGPRKQVKRYTDGLTKQCFKDECDINKIMDRAAQSGTITHLNKFEAVYADYSDFDFMEHTTKLTRGREVFDALPAETRREFGQSPQAFFNYVNDPENMAKPNFGLPALAKPGNQLNDNIAYDANAMAAQAAADQPLDATSGSTPTAPTAAPAAPADPPAS